MRLILASGSPRRRDMFDLMGLDYEIIVSGADENIPTCAPAEFVRQLALVKARDVMVQNPGACVVGADTIVELDGKIIGKPKDANDAFRILKGLSGRTHTVFTGVAILTDEKSSVFHDETRVTFADLTDAEIRAYIATGEPLDKAGAYGIQGPGSFLVKHIDGCYFTIIGMPVPRLYQELKEFGVRPRWME